MDAAVGRRGRLKKLGIAFYCWVKGYFEANNVDQLSSMPDSEKESIEGERVQRNKIPGYSTVDFWEAVDIWRDWKIFGNPEGGGAMDQGALWRDIIRIMYSCAGKHKVE